MKITIEANPAPIVAALEKLSKNYSNMAPVMEIIGDALVSSTMQRFEDSKEPSGRMWDKLSDVTLERRRKKGKDAKPLRDGGYLMNSITRNYGQDWVEVGTPEPYGAFQHFGAKKGAFGKKPFKTKKGSFSIPWGDVPPRPFLGLNQEDEEDIMDILQRYLDVL